MLTPSDALHALYARQGGSTYTQNTRDIVHNANIHVRVKTPECFEGILDPRAHQEIRNARDMTGSNVHDALDQWQIKVLADVCRSLKQYGQRSYGHTTEYRSMSSNMENKPYFKG